MPVPAEPLADFLHCAAGFVALHAIAWAMSENRRAIAWRPVLSGAALTLALGALLLWGGHVLRGFSAAMLLGIVIGTYSSVWIACAALVYLNLRPDQLRPAGEEAVKAKV